MIQDEIIKICSVTGLEIVESERWKNLKLAENYSISFRKIGDHIIEVHGNGAVSNFDASKFQSFLEKFIDDQDIHLPYIEVRNYEDISGLIPSKEAMLKQKTYLIENKEKCAGFIIYNASKPIQTLLMSGRRQYSRINMTLRSEASYRDAILSAVNVINNYQPRGNTSPHKKNYRLKMEDIEQVVLYSGRFLWEPTDLFDLEEFEFDKTNPLYPILQNLSIVREEILDLEKNIRTKSKALEHEKIQTEKIVESLQSGIMIIDPIKGSIMDVNPAACKLIRTDKEKLIGRQVNDYLFGDVYHHNAQLKTFDEEMIPIMRNNVKITLNQKECILENFVDISVAKAHEEKLKKSLEQTQKLNNLTFNREKRIIEMKTEVNNLLKELGRLPKYRSVLSIDGEANE